MVFHKQLVEKVNSGKVVFGIGHMLPSAGMVETISKGWDFLWIDAQHGQHTTETVLRAVQLAPAVEVDTIVRIPGCDYGTLGTYADMSPSGIMVPMVNTPEQARGIVDGLYFAPRGKRSFGGKRSIDLYGRTYHAIKEFLVIAQIETVEAAEHAEEIIAVGGIDVLFFGPNDMKLQLGIPVETRASDDERMVDAMRRVAAAAKSAGKACGIMCGPGPELDLALELGYQVIATGADSGLLRRAAQELLRASRQSLAERYDASY